MKQIRTAIYNGEEIQAEFTQTFELDDYGVPNSPTFWSAMHDVEVTSLAICGVDVKMSDLPESLHDGIIELSNECDWRA